MFKSEFRNTHFSYAMGEDGVEKFVSTPELHSEEAIELDPLRQVRFGESVQADRRRAPAYTDLR